MNISGVTDIQRLLEMERAGERRSSTGYKTSNYSGKGDTVSISAEARTLLELYLERKAEEAEKDLKDSIANTPEGTSPNPEFMTSLQADVITPIEDDEPEELDALDEIDNQGNEQGDVDIEKEISKLEKEIAKLQQQIVEVHESDDAEEVKEAKIASLESQIGQLTQQLVELKLGQTQSGQNTATGKQTAKPKA